ncbi:Cytochrome P450 [Aspergillus sclerotialis]|uniref:Cytochrome P450 n=1 Tax=Aspergillus sclerotialis TaxID=2070753 RepID=A0A3A2ZE82_9EURO|nr:Cytochrome P450 [Aspergillus sclerotialis]
MAVLSDTISFLGQHIVSIALAAIVIHLIRNYFTPGVYSIPGPFVAKLSNIWRFIDVAKGRPDVTLYKLHQKHGDYVRLGPNVVSVRNTDVLKTIYGINKGYQKTSFYRVQQQLAKGKPTPTLFTTLDEDFHAAIKRPVSSAYSMSTLTEFEPFVDSTIRSLFARFDEFVERGEVCDIATWLQYYAFDVIGELTFSKPLGFIEKGRDVGGIIMALEKVLDYSAMIGQMPWLDYLFIKNPLRQFLQGGSTGAVARFARERLNERLHQPKARQETAKEEFPDTVDDTQVFSYTVSNMNAGSDTTAIALRAILYYTLKHPRVLKELQQELNEAFESGRISNPVSWKQSQGLPTVPDGLQLPNGPYLPPGTIVGANPWIIHRHSVFGEDVDSFIPERWLRGENETEAEFNTRKQNMVRATFTFGAGPRTCIGKYISLLEMYKLIPSLFLTYQVELKDPKADWEVVNAWFVRQKKMDVRLTRAH